MKPAVCGICGKIPDKAQMGAWVEFSDYDAEGEKDLSHPDGLEYFCDEHLDAARSLAGLTSAEALKKLQILYSSSHVNQTNESPKKPFWKKWLGG
jgi:hypothetical protein